jgi:hypothetical protein
MRKLASFTGFFFFCSTLTGFFAAGFEAVAPEDYNLEKSLKLKDLPERHALVFLENEKSDNYSGEGYRLFLIVEFVEGSEKGSGSWKVLLNSKELTLCYYCGGVFGDPLENIEFIDEVLYVYHYGGSSLRWSKVITLKEIKNRYFITNYTRSTSNIHSKEESSTHDDLVKKIRTITTINGGGKPQISRLRVPDAKPIRAEQFRY